MRDEEKQARREIERQTILGEVLERLSSDGSEDELYDALVARGYWNEEERGGHSEGVRAGPARWKILRIPLPMPLTVRTLPWRFTPFMPRTAERPWYGDPPSVSY